MSRKKEWATNVCSDCNFASPLAGCSDFSWHAMWHFSALAYAWRVRFPTGREPPQGAVTARPLVSVDSRSGDWEDESIAVGVGRYDLLKCSQGDFANQPASNGFAIVS